MVIKLNHHWHKTASGTDSPLASDDATRPETLGPYELHENEAQLSPIARDRLRDTKRQRREKLVVHNRQQQEQADKVEQDDGDEAAYAAFALVSAEYQRLAQSIADTISDAKYAATRAYERALQEQTEARLALEDVQASALVLADGRRVYFSEDGTQLFDETDRLIAGEAVLAEARRLRAQSPDASTHEVYVEGRQRVHEAGARVEQLSDILHRLDELDEQVQSGKLTADELKEVRRETQEIIQSLPADARRDFEQIRATRERPEDTYTPAAGLYEDEPFASAPNASTHFQVAGSKLSEPAAKPTSDPEERPRPQQTDDYRSAF